MNVTRRVRRLLNWREIHRWATLRCAHYGHRFRWGRDSRHSSRDVYPGPCQGAIAWRRQAEEAYDVLGLVCDYSGVTSREMAVIAELRAETPDERVAASNRVFRVFDNMEKGTR